MQIVNHCTKKKEGGGGGGAFFIVMCHLPCKTSLHTLTKSKVFLFLFYFRFVDGFSPHLDVQIASKLSITGLSNV